LLWSFVLLFGTHILRRYWDFRSEYDIEHLPVQNLGTLSKAIYGKARQESQQHDRTHQQHQDDQTLRLGDIFKNLVFQKRTAELDLQFKRMNVLMLTMASLTFAPLFLQTASFSLFIGLGQSLNLAVAYTVLTVFQQIQSPIRWLPMFIGQFIEFTVAMERIQNFLRCAEINETMVHIDPNRIEAVSIQGNYHWGLEVEKAKQSKLALKR